VRSIQAATEAVDVKGGIGKESEPHLDIGNAFDTIRSSRSRLQNTASDHMNKETKPVPDNCSIDGERLA
jgi:hypothetical protein